MPRENSRSKLVEGVLEAIRVGADQTDRLDQLASSRFGLNRTDARGLEIITRVGPITANRLARDLGMTTGGVTTVIDRLERGGYARRRRDLDDRRRVLVEATDLTQRIGREIFGDLIRNSARLAASYGQRDLEVILGFLKRSNDLAAGHADRLAAKARPPRRRGI